MTHQVILISGTMGSGKTTVLSEASDILSSKGVVHAAIDLDTLGIAHLASGVRGDVILSNLISLCANYRDAGVTRLLLAEALESAEDLDRIRTAIPDAAIVVCRLTTSRETSESRVRVREPGMLQEQLVARVAELDKILREAALENFTLENDHASVTDVAHEMLVRAGWL